jgi:hypothetical protein
MTKYNFTLGADPELFVTDGKTGKIVPVCGKLGGTKALPQWIPGLADGYMFQEDNVALEFNIPPQTSQAHFSAAIARAVQSVQVLAAKAGLSVYMFQGSSHRFRKDQLDNTPLIETPDLKKIPQAHIIGCDPDWCAYGANIDDDPVKRKAFDIEALGTVRHVGGHLHFGYNKELCPEHIFARLVDAFVYLPHLHQDSQTTRRAFYGKAGLYRPKSYGVEYRSMSNFWVVDSTIRDNIAYRSFNLLRALHSNPHEMAELYAELPHMEIKQVIDEGDGQASKALFSKINGKYSAVLVQAA